MSKNIDIELLEAMVNQANELLAMAKRYHRQMSELEETDPRYNVYGTVIEEILSQSRHVSNVVKIIANT